MQSVLKSVYKLQLKKAYYSEPVNFQPVDGAGRTVWMSITRSQDRDENDGTEDQDDRVECFFLTDQTDDDVGGIASLRLNDKFFRDPAYGDPDADPFFFTGEILESGQHYMKAVFQRYRRVSHGARQ